MRKTISFISCLLSTFLMLSAQNATLEGYVFEEGNLGYLKEVQISIYQNSNNNVLAQTTTDENGFFTASLPVGNTYIINASKDLFNHQRTSLMVKKRKKNKKVFVKLKLIRAKKDQFTARSGANLPGIITNDVAIYSQPAKKIGPPVNPDGVAYTDIIYKDDPYADITNATRLAEENYDTGADRESMKNQPMPTAYQPNIKVISPPIRTTPRPNRDLPGNYNRGAAVDKKISPAKPQFGETVVATAQTTAKTVTIPTFFTGYKIEFLTSLTELPASHEIFRRHGNIAMERKENGFYSYLLGNFQEMEQANTFLNESLSERYPSATLVYFENGKRWKSTARKKIKTKPVSAPPR